MATINSSLEELAATISSNTKAVADILASKSLPQPSLSVDGPLALPEGPEYNDLQTARTRLLEALLVMEQLIAGPRDFILWQALSMKHDQFVLEAIERFGIIDAVPLDGDTSYSEIASKTRLSESQVRRILRHAMTRNIFAEPRPGYIVHTAFSAVLVKMPSLRAWVGHNIDDESRASVRMSDAIEKWGESQDPTESGFNLAFNLGKESNVFGFFENDGEGEKKGWRARRFGLAMECMSASGLHDVSHVHRGFDWGAIGKATIVDVGGSTGHISLSLAAEYPDLHFIVQDQQKIANNFNPPPELQARVTFEVHDFFTPQTDHDADIYFLRHILHDWPDLPAVQILRHITRIMKGGAKIIIMDSVMPPRGVLPVSVERTLTSLDLQMWATFNAKERTMDDWESLLKEAEPRLKIQSCKKPEGSGSSIIVAQLH